MIAYLVYKAPLHVFVIQSNNFAFEFLFNSYSGIILNAFLDKFWMQSRQIDVVWSWKYKHALSLELIKRLGWLGVADYALDELNESCWLVNRAEIRNFHIFKAQLGWYLRFLQCKNLLIVCIFNRRIKSNTHTPDENSPCKAVLLVNHCSGKGFLFHFFVRVDFIYCFVF